MIWFLLGAAAGFAAGYGIGHYRSLNAAISGELADIKALLAKVRK